MKTGMISLVFALTLAACASGPVAYGPARGSGVGFRAQQIQNDRAQVSFTAYDPDEAHNFALLRAAELAKGAGYTDFRVISGRIYTKNRSSPITTHIGAGIGKSVSLGGGVYGGVGLGVGKALGSLGGEKVTASLDVQFLNAGGQNGPAKSSDIYNVDSILQSIRPARYKP